LQGYHFVSWIDIFYATRLDDLVYGMQLKVFGQRRTCGHDPWLVDWEGEIDISSIKGNEMAGLLVLISWVVLER